MNILKSTVIALLMGVMSIEEVQAVSLNKHHKKHHRHHTMIQTHKDEDKAAPKEEKKEAAAADDAEPKSKGTKEVDSAAVKDLKDKTKEIQEKIDAKEGKTIEKVEVSEDEQKAADKAEVDNLANAALRKNARDAHAKARGDLQKAKDVVKTDWNEDKKKEHAEKLEKLEKKVTDAAAVVNKMEETLAEDTNQNLDKEKEIKELKKDLKDA